MGISRSFRSLALAAGALVLVACGARGPAEAALTAADEAVASVQAEASKVAPDRLAELQASVAAARQQLEAGEYQAALDAATGIPAQVDELKASLPALVEEMTASWNALSEAMPRNLDAVKAKLDQYRGNRLPPGATAEQLAAARATHEAAPAAWQEAVALWQGGDMAGALTKAMDLKARVSDAMTTVGLVSDESAWGNARPVRP